jgi:hypothetical protein
MPAKFILEYTQTSPARRRWTRFHGANFKADAEIARCFATASGISENTTAGR